jgi:hypothetical protein
MQPPPASQPSIPVTMQPPPASQPSIPSARDVVSAAANGKGRLLVIITAAIVVSTIGILIVMLS